MTDTRSQEMFIKSNPYRTDHQGDYIRALFVCTAGLLRSPTAAAIASGMGWNTRSCGTDSFALIPISPQLINWADKLYFINPINFYTVKEKYTIANGSPEWLPLALVQNSTIWDIPDEYDYMDPELVKQIRELLA